jgi:KRAB domain-containing zinc finger protein
VSQSDTDAAQASDDPKPPLTGYRLVMSLVEHLLPAKELPTICTFCHKKFAHRSSLATHTLSHIGARPFTCHLCDYAATTQQTLDIHVFRKHNQAHSP